MKAYINMIVKKRCSVKSVSSYGTSWIRWFRWAGPQHALSHRHLAKERQQRFWLEQRSNTGNLHSERFLSAMTQCWFFTAWSTRGNHSSDGVPPPSVQSPKISADRISLYTGPFSRYLKSYSGILSQIYFNVQSNSQELACSFLPNFIAKSTVQLSDCHYSAFLPHFEVVNVLQWKANTDWTGTFKSGYSVEYCDPLWWMFP